MRILAKNNINLYIYFLNIIKKYYNKNIIFYFKIIKDYF